MWNVLTTEYNPLNLKILQTEDQFDLQVKRDTFKYNHKCDLSHEDMSGHYSLRGTIDLITEYDEDTIEVIDYKTGQRKDWITGKVKEWEDFKKDIQLKMYNIATHAMYKKYKNRILTIIFTRDGGPFSVSFNEEELQDSLESFRRMFIKISDDENPSRLKDDDSRKSEHWKCKNVCNFGKTKDEDGRSLCDVYYEMLDEYGYRDTTQILHTLTLEGNEVTSRRNDYENSKITYGEIK